MTGLFSAKVTMTVAQLVLLTAVGLGLATVTFFLGTIIERDKRREHGEKENR